MFLNGVNKHAHRPIIDKVTEKSYTAFAANSCLFYRNRVVAIVGMLVEEKFPWNNQPC